MAVTREQVRALADAECDNAIKCLDIMFGLPENTTSVTHRIFVESIIKAAMLEITLVQLGANK
jgi:hypothetical protein